MAGLTVLDENTTLADLEDDLVDDRSIGRSSQVPLTQIGEEESPIGNILQKDKERESWGNKAEFILATIGLAVGLGNIWRFPYLCQKNGGGAFLIPFFIFMVIEGIPLFFIELGIGQRFRKTSIEAWGGIHKGLMGIGVSCLIISSMLCVYYVIVISWCCYYFFISFTSSLPWQKKYCPTYDNYTTLMKRFENATHWKGKNVSVNVDIPKLNSTLVNWTDCCIHDPPQYFWYEKTLQVSSNMLDGGVGMNLHLLGCLVFAWTFVYLCICKGIKSSGKAVYFTATFPYVVLIALFFRGVTLPGASIGIKAFFTPKWELLLKPEIWLDAATQIFFSLSLGFGALVAFASYNPINNNIIRDSYIIVLTDCATAVFGGVVVFSILGFREHVTGIPVTEGGSGPGLAFITFSDALTMMEVSPLWAVLFFFMLVLLGIDSEFGTLESVIAPFYDLKMVKIRKEIFLALVALVMFFIGLSMVSGPGYYVFQIFDDYSVTIPLLVVGLVQCIAIGWVYGSDKFADDIEFMTGRRPYSFWMFCWKYLSPLALIIILIWTLVSTAKKKPQYTAYHKCPQANGFINDDWTIKIDYPVWAQVIAICTILAAVLPMPIFAIKHWPRNWKAALRERFASGWVNYMPDPSAWKQRHDHKTMVYNAASQDDNDKI